VDSDCPTAVKLDGCGFPGPNHDNLVLNEKIVARLEGASQM
jgi:hypothetical protein